MTATLLQPIEPDEHATPQDDDLKLWSVTTIIGVLDKPALMYWAASEAAECAIDNERTWKAMLGDDGREAAIKYIRDARFRRPKDRLSDTEFGSRVHRLCEQYALTGTRPEVTDDLFLSDVDTARRCMDQFDRWLQDFRPEYVASELTIYTPEYGIAGTCDGFLNIDNTRLIFDIKSSKKSYDANGKPAALFPEVSLQLAAYRHASMAAVWRVRRYERFRRRYYLLSGQEREQAIPVPEVDGGIGIKITPDHCTAFPVRCDREVYDYFLFCLEVARFRFDVASHVIGDPLQPSARTRAV